MCVCVSDYVQFELFLITYIPIGCYYSYSICRQFQSTKIIELNNLIQEI